jgi:hypothetical protein
VHRLTRHIVRIVAVAGLAVASLVISTPAHAANKGSSIGRGEYLNQGDYLTRSITGHSVQLIMQRDAGSVIWRSNTIGETWETGQNVNIAADGDLYVGYKKVDSC